MLAIGTTLGCGTGGPGGGEWRRGSLRQPPAAALCNRNFGARANLGP